MVVGRGDPAGVLVSGCRRPTRSPRGTSCTSCPIRSGRDHCARSSYRCGLKLLIVLSLQLSAELDGRSLDVRDRRAGGSGQAQVDTGNHGALVRIGEHRPRGPHFAFQRPAPRFEHSDDLVTPVRLAAQYELGAEVKSGEALLGGLPDDRLLRALDEPPAFDQVHVRVHGEAHVVHAANGDVGDVSVAAAAVRNGRLDAHFLAD